MSMNVNNVNGGGSGYGVNWNNNRNNGDVDTNNAKEQTAANVNQERKDVNPDDVMKFLANNNYFMPVQVEAKPVSEVGGVDAETEERIAGYMERFEEIYAIVEQEFGAELAPSVMDLVMDKLMGMA